MPSRRPDLPAGAQPGASPGRLPVFVAGRAGLETHNSVAVFDSPDRSGPDWRMSTAPLHREPGIAPGGPVGHGGGRDPGGGRRGTRGAPPGRSAHHPERGGGLGRRAVVAIALAAALAGVAAGAGVSILSHHDSQRAADPAATSVKAVTRPAGYRARSQVVERVSPAIGDVAAPRRAPHTPRTTSPQ